MIRDASIAKRQDLKMEPLELSKPNEEKEGMSIFLSHSVKAPKQAVLTPDEEEERNVCSDAESREGQKTVTSAKWSGTRLYICFENGETLSYTKKGAISVLGLHQTKWCVSHEGEELTPEVAHLWGFSDIVLSNIDNEENRRRRDMRKNKSLSPWMRSALSKQGKWVIERIVLGTGKADNSGIVLDKDRMYGSSHLHGGHESFYPIQLFTLDIRLFIPRKGFPKLEFEENISKTGPCFFFKEITKEQALDTALWHCKQRPGVPLVIGGPGARENIRSLRKYNRRDNWRVFLGAINHGCIHAAVINSIYLLRGADIAYKALSCARESFLKSLGDASEWIKRLHCHVELRKLTPTERKELAADPFKWIACQKHGVFVVRFYGNPEFDHCIAVDGCESIIVDSSLRHPLGLSEEALCECARFGSKVGRLGEIRRLKAQVLGKRHLQNEQPAGAFL